MDTDSASEEARFEGAPLRLRPPNVQLDDLESRLEDQGRLIREQWASIAVLGNHIQEAEAGTSPRSTSCLFLGSSLAAAFAGGAIGRRCGHFASPALANSAADRGRGGLRTGGRRSLPVHGAGGVSLELVDGRGGQADRDRLATSVGSRFHFDVPLGRESGLPGGAAAPTSAYCSGYHHLDTKGPTTSTRTRWRGGRHSIGCCSSVAPSTATTYSR